jgi:hypothetical protein
MIGDVTMDVTILILIGAPVTVYALYWLASREP